MGLVWPPPSPSVGVVELVVVVAGAVADVVVVDPAGVVVPAVVVVG
ncbi:MAG: hypothetical protein ACYCXW_21520 [Solirubrobacteraceae bacterium]